jgi:hypothetical protein
MLLNNQTTIQLKTSTLMYQSNKNQNQTFPLPNTTKTPLVTTTKT